MIDHALNKQQTPRIYVACLAAYNNGKLHGTWIDCDQDAEDIWAEIEQMLKTSPEPDAEEWAIHDYEGWQGISIDESTHPEKIAELAELLEKYGTAFAKYYEYHSDYASAEDFQEHYVGEYESEEDFVYAQWEESGQLKQLEDSGIPESYINWKAIARDWFIDSYYSIEAGYQEVHVFRC
ncbi:antirestriction protein ArdA [Coleofasciculus sp.]|uniref:antirestriction protein ArdA n=1 Tax=Coleofasciculus sp. TaxID=3100458 RepID=UPI003A2F5020